MSKTPTIRALKRLFFALVCGGAVMDHSLAADQLSDRPAIMTAAPSQRILTDADPPLYLFNEGEWFIDVFGSGAEGNAHGRKNPNTGNSRAGYNFDEDHGVGLGAGYFFTRHLGAMVEGYGLDIPGHHITLLGGLIVRIPVDDFALSFYGFAEAGAYFGNSTRPTFQFGGGVDVRLTDHVGTFFDARIVSTNNEDEGDDFTLLRLGLRFTF